MDKPLGTLFIVRPIQLKQSLVLMWCRAIVTMYKSFQSKSSFKALACVIKIKVRIVLEMIQEIKINKTF